MDHHVIGPPQSTERQHITVTPLVKCVLPVVNAVLPAPSHQSTLTGSFGQLFPKEGSATTMVSPTKIRPPPQLNPFYIDNRNTLDEIYEDDFLSDDEDIYEEAAPLTAPGIHDVGATRRGQRHQLPQQAGRSRTSDRSNPCLSFRSLISCSFIVIFLMVLLWVFRFKDSLLVDSTVDRNHNASETLDLLPTTEAQEDQTILPSVSRGNSTDEGSL